MSSIKTMSKWNTIKKERNAKRLNFINMKT